jgi:hypothetical protein
MNNAYALIIAITLVLILAAILNREGTLTVLLGAWQLWLGLLKLAFWLMLLALCALSLWMLFTKQWILAGLFLAPPIAYMAFEDRRRRTNARKTG